MQDFDVHIVVVSDLPQFVTGGAETQALRLIEAWLSAGHDVVCLGRRMGQGPVRAGQHTVKVHRISTSSFLGRLGRGISYFVSLTSLLLHYRHWADVVYTRFLGEAAITVVTLKRLRLLHVVLVATPANVGGQGDLFFLQTIPCNRWLIRLLDHHCDAINLIAPGMARELTAAGFSSRNFSHIPNGIQVTPRAKFKPVSTVRFIAVGRLTAQKGLDILLRAVALISAQLTPGQIVLVGSGPERGRLVSLSQELGISNLITWTGQIDPQEVKRHLEQAQVFLLSSRYEGLSNAGLEAMERGLAIILTRCEGLDVHVQSSMGWVVEPEDPTELARALCEAISMPSANLLSMGEHCRAYVMQHFELKEIAERYLALFEHLLHAKLGAKHSSIYDDG